MVRAMFPDIPTAAIQADLQRTGSVETTVDNALRDGGLPLVSLKLTVIPIYIHVFE
jgi:coupling of ubiquitin conjugation to ER degradation protein 1